MSSYVPRKRTKRTQLQAVPVEKPRPAKPKAKTDDGNSGRSTDVQCFVFCGVESNREMFLTQSDSGSEFIQNLGRTPSASLSRSLAAKRLLDADDLGFPFYRTWVNPFPSADASPFSPADEYLGLPQRAISDDSDSSSDSSEEKPRAKSKKRSMIIPRASLSREHWLTSIQMQYYRLCRVETSSWIFDEFGTVSIDPGTESPKAPVTTIWKPTSTS